MMPQKKNPDSLELVRGKTGRVYGNLMSLLTVMKGVPLTYSKDMQEDKEAFFDTVDTVWISLEVFTGAWSSMKVNSERMKASLDGMILATDLADYLARKGLPFRTCHHVVGRLVKRAGETGKTLVDLDLETLRAESEVFEEDVAEILTAENSTSMRNIQGGTGRNAVMAQTAKGWNLLAERIKETEL
jgi:argininosuccinate lyase